MTNYQPKITYIVAQKKNNVRLFKERVDNPRDANVPAGEQCSLSTQGSGSFH